MKQKFKKIVINNWLFIFMVLIIQIKSMFLLSMLRTPGSAKYKFNKNIFWCSSYWHTFSYNNINTKCNLYI